ncbi:MAG: DUF6093 family protein [Pseudonocardiaceae bacterium]
MSVTAAVSAGRAAAEARMTSRCTVRRKTGETPEGEIVWTDVYTDLPVRLAGTIRGQSQARRVETAGVEFEIAMRTANFPASTDNLRDNDLAEITSGDNAGVVLRIVEADWQDQSTARRVPVVATLRPEEWV